MKLSVAKFIEFVNFIRRADEEGQLNSIDVYGVDPSGTSSDPNGDDPYYDYVTLAFENEDGERHEVYFDNTTIHIVLEAMWGLVDALPIT